MRWRCVAIVGVGLIGGSLGLALRRAGAAERVVGIGRNHERLQLAASRDAITDWTTDLSEGVSEAELVVVCSPVDCIAQHVVAALKATREAVVTDVGSTKTGIVARVVARATPRLARRFVGGHPIAGSEQSGPAAARADLFEGRTVVLTPTRGTSRQAIRLVRAMWQRTGAKVVEMTPQAHDRVLATTSHLPHVVAAALAAVTQTKDLPWAGTGWADTTRIAAGDADLWRAILMENRRPTLRELEKFAKVLAEFRSALASCDEQRLRKLLLKGKRHRDALGS